MTELVFILSVNYSGSHLLAQLLGAHSRCASIGELKNYEKVIQPANPRHADSDLAQNPLYADLLSRDRESWYEILHQRIRAAHPAVDVLIDNSKKVEWARSFQHSKNYRIRYIHLLRDPRALLRRWLNDFQAPGLMRRQRLKLMRSNPARLPVAIAGSDHDVLLYKWLDANRRIAGFLKSSGKPHAVVTYHDLATRTADTLSRLMPAIGLEYEAEQLAYAAGTSFGTRKRAYVDMSARSEIRFDTRWKQELDSAALRAVDNCSALHAWLDRVGVQLGENGLVQR